MLAFLMSASAWPEFSWTVSSDPSAWLDERIREMATRARAFELALDEASTAGTAPLAPVVSAIEKWDKVAADVWMYAGLKVEQLMPEELAIHAQLLEKIWEGLSKYRRRILKGVGEAGAEKIQSLETTIPVTKEHFAERVGELEFGGTEVDALGVITHHATRPVPTGKPVTAEEMRSRAAAEGKRLPEPTTIENVLAQHPVPWVHSIFESLELNLEEAPPEVKSLGTRTDAQRIFIAQRLVTPDFLREVVLALEEEDRTLLTELLEETGGVRYGEVTARYGKDEADGFYWSERAPSGPLARLRRAGLVTVGERGDRVVVVMPEDLRAPIREVLSPTG